MPSSWGTWPHNKCSINIYKNIILKDKFLCTHKTKECIMFILFKNINFILYEY